MAMRRLYEQVLAEHFRDERKMLFLMGPRQVGKTTTGREMARLRRRSAYLNWDDFDHQKQIVAGPSRLAEGLGSDVLAADRPLLILDEIHKYPRWRSLLKGFFDTHGDATDVLVTGSARLSAFHSSGESLMGRYFSYRMHPLSVAELVRPEVGEEPGQRPPAAIDDRAFSALVDFGGFPEPFARASERFSLRWRRLRHQQLFREELRDLTRVQELAKVQTLAQLVRERAGQLVTYSSLADGLDASIDSVKRWLATLESLYFCFPLRPWFRNVARSLRKEPKFFLWDWSLIDDPGRRFENLVASALLKAVHLWTDHGFGEFDLHFLRDKEKREVDFLVSRGGRPWMLVEAKLSSRGGLSPSLLHFQEQLGAERVLEVAFDLPHVDRSCFDLPRPAIVPARTFLSQLV
jgi:predicted AAA+ superfamily ATPase